MHLVSRDSLQAQTEVWALMRFILFTMTLGFIWYTDNNMELTMFWVTSLAPTSLMLFPIHFTITSLPDFSVELYVFFVIMFCFSFFAEVGQIVTAVLMYKASAKRPKLSSMPWVRAYVFLWVTWLLLSTVAIGVMSAQIPPWRCPDINVHGMGASIGMSWILGWSGIYAIIHSGHVMSCSPSDVPKMGVVLAYIWVVFWVLLQCAGLAWVIRGPLSNKIAESQEETTRQRAVKRSKSRREKSRKEKPKEAESSVGTNDETKAEPTPPRSKRPAKSSVKVQSKSRKSKEDKKKKAKDDSVAIEMSRKGKRHKRAKKRAASTRL